MFAIISLIPEEHWPVLRTIQKTLNEGEHSLDGEQEYFHFSWQVAEGYDLNILPGKLTELAKSTEDLEISINGIGIFTGIMPVIYLPIIKSRHLIRVHQEIWNITQDVIIKPIEYYGIEEWIPHITLQQKVELMRNFSSSVNKIISLPIKLKMKIDNFAIGETDDTHAKILEVIKFGKKI